MLQVLSKWWVVFLLMFGVALAEDMTATMRNTQPKQGDGWHMFDADKSLPTLRNTAGAPYSVVKFECAEEGPFPACFQTASTMVCSTGEPGELVLRDSGTWRGMELAVAPVCYDERPSSLTLTFAPPIDSFSWSGYGGDSDGDGLNQICCWRGVEGEPLPVLDPGDAFCTAYRIGHGLGLGLNCWVGSGLDCGIVACVVEGESFDNIIITPGD